MVLMFCSFYNGYVYADEINACWAQVTISLTWDSKSKSTSEDSRSKPKSNQLYRLTWSASSQWKGHTMHQVHAVHCGGTSQTVDHCGHFLKHYNTYQDQCIHFLLFFFLSFVFTLSDHFWVTKGQYEIIRKIFKWLFMFQIRYVYLSKCPYVLL
jgi:hypothetical protein